MSDRPGTGHLLVIVGPSGAGKDTLIDGLRTRYDDDPRGLFVQRTVTRPAQPGAEDHASLSFDAFAAAERSGRFAVTWDANGLRYGLPAAVHAHLSTGGLAIANGSRQALPAIRAAFPALTVVAVEVDEAELRRRLDARGRETPAEIEARLERARSQPITGDDIVRLDNSGPPEAAIAALAGMVAARLG
ncbi:phosphonate metabolism protein/1,5-bisphosphokinase (PRPP-forming) PhnN [Minwuia sp.]|uniref:phosphonate metabolism protein/1,5-bisphosphokinase (PRPP-forming) PhnN n=1 Tax=Minwuia sp. TaxID=2493630 RepID=UPI003A916F10